MLLDVNLSPEEEKRLSEIPELKETVEVFLRDRLSLEDWRKSYHEPSDLAEARTIIKEVENESPQADGEEKQRFWKLYDRIG